LNLWFSRLRLREELLSLLERLKLGGGGGMEGKTGGGGRRRRAAGFESVFERV
jgi:hypothetical protein